MVFRHLQVSAGHLDLILWAKATYELESELSPSGPGEQSCLLCKSHGSICETPSAIAFYE